MATRLLLDERILGDGRHARTYAALDGDRLRISDDEATGVLSFLAVDRVMCKYGLPLDASIRLDGDVIELEGCKLRRLRYHAPVDAEARDYLVWEKPGEPALAVIATHATAALRYLVLRLEAERRPSEN
ncbi:MAG TPA: hypothetical protein VIV58_21655 [Kofleriaceae bacterium]